MCVFRILGLGIRPCVCGVGFRLPVGVVQANPSGIDLAHDLGGGLPEGGGLEGSEFLFRDLMLVARVPRYKT